VKIPERLKWKPTGQSLGKGGQGSVFVVVDKTSESEDRYAMKVLTPGKPPKVYERFAREIGAMMILDHPSIPKIFDHSQAGDDFQFYVMEFIPGAQSLKSLLNTAKNPYHANVLVSLSLFEEIARVIAFCEAQGIVHRDLSSQNVLVLPDGGIRIIDFGICQIDETSTITLVDEGLGTRNYAPPECESGFGGKITSKSDLYSAGKILWSAVTNRHAFAREAPIFGANSLPSVLPDRPDTWHLFHIFEKTIRKDVRHRFENAGTALECCREIRRLVFGGFPPIEMLETKCPLCGIGSIDSFTGSHMVFGNPNPPNVHAYKCDRCGYCFAVDDNVANIELERRRALE
jgi:serine/threonine protein kinase